MKENIANTTNSIRRDYIATGLSYSNLVAAFERQLGRFDQAAAATLVQRNAPWHEVELEMQNEAGPHGLMIFFTANQGSLISLSGRGTQKCTLYLVGNPVIAQRIISVDVRGSLYVPFRVCIFDDDGPGGATISFDRPSSFLATLERPEFSEIGLLLDQKIDGVVRAIRDAKN